MLLLQYVSFIISNIVNNSKVMRWIMLLS